MIWIFFITLRISRVKGLGPLEENYATYGAIASLSVSGSETRIVAIGFLKKVDIVSL